MFRSKRFLAPCPAARNFSAGRVLAFCLSVLLLVSCCSASLAEEDKSASYQNAQRLVEAGAYAEAVEAFEALGNHEDSALYLLYAQGMMALESEEWKEANAIFSTLGIVDFLDSGEMHRYVQARQLEALGDLQGALDLYGTLDVQDSILRQVGITRQLADQGKAQAQEAPTPDPTVAPTAEPTAAPTPEPTPPPPASISDLSVSIVNPSTVQVTWSNPENVLCEVQSRGDRHINTYTQDSSGTSALVNYLVPGDGYTIGVLDTVNNEILETWVQMPQTSPYEEYNYRITSARVYYIKDPNRALWDQSYSILSTAKASKVEEMLDEGRHIALYFEIRMSKTNTVKSFGDLTVLKTPSGNAYIQMHDPLNFPGDWNAAKYYYTCTSLLEDCREDETFIPGTYTLEVYEKGLILGSATFVIE